MEYAFDINDAQKYGLEEAVVIKLMSFWISKNMTEERNQFEGRTWTFNTVEAWSKHFPFWTPKQMRRVLESLKDQGVILTGNFNKTNQDRTLWYAFVDESSCPNGKMDLPKRENGFAQTGTPLPVILPVTKKSKQKEGLLFPSEEAGPDVLTLADEVMKYLNTASGSSFRSHRRTGLADRIAEGRSLDDFRAVIDVKVAEWKGGEFEKYLTPQTLFRSVNFENYLNQARIAKAKTSGDSWRFSDPLLEAAQ